MHARIQIYWCRSSIFRHLKLELLTQFPASNDEKYINVVYIWRKFVSFYGYVHWRMTTEISVMYGGEKVNNNYLLVYNHSIPLLFSTRHFTHTCCCGQRAQCYSTRTKRWSNDGLFLDNRLRRSPTLAQHWVNHRWTIWVIYGSTSFVNFAHWYPDINHFIILYWQEACTNG